MTENTLIPTTTLDDRPAAALRGLCGGAVHLPGDPGYAAATVPWNVCVAQHPAAVALPRNGQDVVDVVRAARAAGLRVAPQSSGHGAAHDPDLFWALRGGSGNFGVVTATEHRLHPIPDVVAGLMLWDRERAPEVLPAWVRWTKELPEEVTTACRVLSLPPLPELPDFLRGRQLVVVDGALLSEDETADGLLADLRALGPELDTFTRMPAAALTRLHVDPEGPSPAVGNHVLLDDLPEAAVEALLDQVGPGRQTALLSAELRHLGGALARSHPGGDATDRLDGAYAGFFVAIAPTPEATAAGSADAAAAVAALTPWSSGRSVLNLVEEPRPARAGFAPESWQRLLDVQHRVDPDQMFVASHRIAEQA